MGLDFVWPEVGIMRVVPAVGDADYLGSGDVSGDPSVEIGRFIPDHFTTTQNLPAFASVCSTDGFTYLGQSFDYVTAPLITATARAQTGTATLNYTDTFFKLVTTSLQNRQYQTLQGTLDPSGLPPITADPGVTETMPGTAGLLFSAGTGLRYTRAAPVAPFDAVISLSIDVIDSDGVVALGNPITFDSGPGIAFSGGAAQRYGRIRIGTAVGSELVNLPVSMTVEYFASAAQGFLPHADDTCSNSVDLSFGNFTENLGPTDTCALDIGAPGLSNVGCAAPSATPYQEPPAAGDFNLILAAPGATNTGGLVITADVPAWLRFDWNSLSAGDENPTGQATFGLYPGEGRHIYQREVY
jgi:MSHA biogenesis protein MshQ